MTVTSVDTDLDTPTLTLIADFDASVERVRLAVGQMDALLANEMEGRAG